MFIGKNFQSLLSISYNPFWREKINKKKKMLRGGESYNSEKRKYWFTSPANTQHT